MNIAPASPVVTVAELRRQWADFCVDQRPTHALTLAYNDSVSLLRLRSDLRCLHARIDRRLFGSRFNVLSYERRTWFVAFPEHLDTNAHAHLVARVQPDRAGEFECMFPAGSGQSEMWTRFAPAGTYALQPLLDPAGWARYAVKDLTPEGQWILSDEFLSHAIAA